MKITIVLHTDFVSQVRVALVTFDDHAELVFDLDEYAGRMQVTAGTKTRL